MDGSIKINTSRIHARTTATPYTGLTTRERIQCAICGVACAAITLAAALWLMVA